MTLENQAADNAALASEIFSNTPPERDSAGTSAPAQTEPKQEAATPQSETAQPEPDDDHERPEDRERHVPLSELKATRRKYKERFTQAEQQLQLEKAQNQTLQQQLQQVLQHLSRPQQQPAQAQQPQQVEDEPDPFLDPQGWLDRKLSGFTQTIEQRVTAERVADSRDMAIEKHGEDAVNAAVQAAQQMGKGFLGRFTAERRPFISLMNWHKQHVAQQTVGNDLDAYNRRIAEQVIEAVKTGKPLPYLAQPGAQPQAAAQAQQIIPPRPGQQAPQQQPQQFPGSLSHVQGTTAAVPISDEALAREIFSGKR